MAREEAKVDRYSRQWIMTEIGNEGQNKLQESKVLVIGAGGLGSPVISYLAAAGVGIIGVVDFDRVDVSNLHRQLIHNESSVGKLKTESAELYLKNLNHETTYISHSTRLSELNALTIINGYDLVIDGSDNLSTRYLVNDACVILEIPLIFGSVHQFDGQVSVFDSRSGPCYRCVFPSPPPAFSVPNCALSGVLGSVCGTIGTIMATEAVKILLGIDSLLRNSILMYAAKSAEFDRIHTSKNANCSICSLKKSERKLAHDYLKFCGEPRTVTIDALRIYRDSKSVLLLDVRSNQEYLNGNIPGSINIPSEVFVSEFPKLGFREGSILVLYCETGKRSSACFAELSDEIQNRTLTLEGGYAAWNSQQLTSGAH